MEQDVKQMIEKLREIHEHLEGGAALYPGSRIFAEDEDAVVVIGNLLKRVLT